MNEAIREAEATVRRAETYLNQMARFLCGRLWKANPDILRELKRNSEVLMR